MSRLIKGLPYLATIGHRGFTAGSNLLLTIFAGRTLIAADFGELALMMAAIAVLMIFHSTLFSEPMLVYGPKDYRPGLRRYLTMLGTSQFAFGLLGAVVIAVMGVAMGNPAYIAFAVVVPLALSLDFQDRSFFMQVRPQVPFLSALTQFLVLSGLLFVGPGQSAKTIADFLWIYAASFGASNLLLLGAHLISWPKFGTDDIETRDVINRHTRFAAWSMVSHLLLFMITNFYIFVLPVLQDIETTANFRAQSAITGPGAQAFSALGLMAVPMLRLAANAEDFVSQLKRLLLVITTIGGAITLVIGIWGEPLIGLVYADKYGMLPIGYWLAGLYPLAIGYAFMMGSALRAMDRADLVARSAGFAVATCLLPGLWLTYQFGTEGVILAQVVGSLTMAGRCVYVLRPLLKSSLQGEA